MASLYMPSLLQTLLDNPLVAAAVNLEQIITFVDLIRHLKERILWNQSSGDLNPPASLPLSIHRFLCDAVGLEHEVAKLAWFVFKETAWNDPGAVLHGIPSRSAALLPHFLKYGPAHHVAFHDFYPPHRTCIDPRCAKGRPGHQKEHELGEAKTHTATILTRSYGALPCYSTSFYCRKCKTRYHHNFRIHTNANIRSYYPGVPSVVQAAKHFFMETALCEIFATMMNCAWTSASNCARIYNQSFAPEALNDLVPADWKPKLALKPDFVWDAFYLHALLQDHTSHSKILQLPHKAKSQAERLRPVLEDRNKRMMGTGQEHWNHACDKCTQVSTDEDGKRRVLRAAVTDGITLGHPCCAGDIECKNPLPNNHAIYCDDHAYKQSFCAVLSCNHPVSPGHRTCEEPEHRACEEYHRMMGKGMFQLKSRLERNKVTQNNEATPADDLEVIDHPMDGSAVQVDSQPNEGAGLHDEEVLVSATGEAEPASSTDDPTCPSKPDEGNRKIKARFGRKRTHNEELAVATCGVILARATFYGSEGPNGVRLFWHGVYPTKASLPEFMFMDSNCSTSALIKNLQDTHFDKCALPVDVFHYKCKHKKTDTWCTQNCNPALWPELMTADGCWRFNSSAAEQTNAWIGGFLAIVREMRVERYNFFLDEMIRRRNIMLVGELANKGYAPYSIPRDVLLRAD